MLLLQYRIDTTIIKHKNVLYTFSAYQQPLQIIVKLYDLALQVALVSLQFAQDKL
jgi:hypothetical protein